MQLFNRYKEVFIRTLVIIVPIALIFGIIFVYVYKSEVRHDHTELFNHEEQILAQQRSKVTITFENVASTLLTISENHVLMHFLKSSSKEQMGDLENDFLRLSKITGLYDQVRYIASDGMEVIRINYNNGNPIVVPKDKLQNKGSRYYFTDTIRLNRGEIFISPLDLNIEQGHIETPHKPMIRFGTPVYDDTGNKRGIVLLNFNAGRMLKSLKDALAYAHGKPMMLNSEGYWLLSPNAEDEWGFMFKNNITFQNRYPKDWAGIKSNESGHLISSEGLFSFTTINPIKKVLVSSTGAGEAYSLSSNDYKWKLLLHIPHEKFTVYSDRLAFSTISLYLFSMLIVFILLIRNAIASQKRKIAETKIQDSQKSLLKSQEIAKLGNWDWDIEKNTLYWSDEIYRIFGLSPKTFAATYEAFINTVHPDDRELVSESVDKALKNKQPYNIDHRILLPSGDIKIVQEQAEIVCDDNGNPLRMTGTVQDITERKKVELELTYNQTYLKSIIDNEPECVKLLESDGTLIDMNPSGLAMIEAEGIEQVRGQNINGIVAPEYRDDFASLTKRVCNGETGTLQFKIIGLKGSERWLETRAVPFYDEKKERTLLLGVTRDITERLQVEKQLLDSQQFFKNVVELTNAIHWEFSFKDNKFTYVSPQSESILGYTPDEWTDFDFWANTIHSDDREWVINYCKEKTEQLTGHEFVYRMISKEGKPVWLHDIVHVVSENKKPIKLNGIMLNVTHLKETERAIRQREERLDLTVKGADLGTWDWNIQTSEVSFNDRWSEMLGYSPDEMEPSLKTWEKLLCPDDKDYVYKVLNEHLEGKSPIYQTEHRLLTKSGKWKWILDSGKVVEWDDEGKPLRATGIHMDIDKQKQAEAALKQTLNDKDMLMKEVHHRTKNNLAVIQSLLSLQVKDISDDKSKEYFADAQNRVRSMTMIHEMLHKSNDITKLGTSEYIRNFVDTLIQNYKTSAQNINLQYDIDDINLDVDTMIPLGLIINELVSNALKYAFPDDAEGALSISLKETEGKSYKLIIKDTGAGLPEDFDLNKAQSLGLLIVNSLVTQIDGALELSNKDGAEFRIAFTDRTIRCEE